MSLNNPLFKPLLPSDRAALPTHNDHETTIRDPDLESSDSSAVDKKNVKKEPSNLSVEVDIKENSNSLASTQSRVSYISALGCVHYWDELNLLTTKGVASEPYVQLQ